MKRRSFIKRTALTSAAFLIPEFLRPLQRYFPSDYRNLVVIQLSGGNDGLNTVIPFENDLYYNLRKTISVPKEQVLKLDDYSGLHPSMKGLQELYREGLLCIINSVGYPNPDRSHFRSMDIWHSASDASKYVNTGWIGRFLDSDCDGCAFPYTALELDQTLSLALKGENRKGLALNNMRQLYNQTREPFFKETLAVAGAESENVAYLYKTMAETYSSAEYIFETTKTFNNDFEYPKGNLSAQLQKIATCIGSGMSTKVYYASLGGFDTHVGQINRQENLLRQFSESSTAFVRNLQKMNKLENTLVMVFSEFGRRVQQNASNGTDHGTANQVFLMGAGLRKKGFYNEAPSLSDLDEGDLKFKIDFRNVYASVLNNWLKADSKIILGKQFDLLDII